MQEAQSQASTTTTLFTYRFKDPGVYVFYLSSNVNKKMVIRLVLLWNLTVFPIDSMFFVFTHLQIDMKKYCML